MAVKRRRATHPDEGASAVGLTTATARTLLEPLAGGGGRAELVARRLGAAIRLGMLLDGERLPAESQLAAQLGVATVTLREALMTLREQGLVTTRRGRGGGTFVRAPADLDEPLRRFSVTDLRDLGDIRAATAGTAARLAAERALPDEVRRLTDQVQRLEAAGTASERRRADTELTIAIAAAAQSPRLTREEARLRAEIGDLLGLELGQRDHAAVVRGRRRLVAAIGAGAAARARRLAEDHIAAETARLIGLRLEMATPPAPRRPARAADAALRDVVSELDTVFAELGELGGRLASLVDAAAGRPRRDDLEPLRPAIFALLETHADLVTGAGIISAPDLLVDAPRWMEWWWTGERGTPEALRVNLDPLAPDFFDYTLQDWYATPEETRERRMAGPFVDYACTNEYAITLACPVRSAGDAFAGVAAADVLVSSIERRVLPALAGLGRPVALTSADGRVIVSNDATVGPGRRLSLGDAAARVVPPASPVRSWLLVDLPAPS